MKKYVSTLTALTLSAMMGVTAVPTTSLAVFAEEVVEETVTEAVADAEAEPKDEDTVDAAAPSADDIADFVTDVAKNNGISKSITALQLRTELNALYGSGIFNVESITAKNGGLSVVLGWTDNAASGSYVVEIGKDELTDAPYRDGSADGVDGKWVDVSANKAILASAKAAVEKAIADDLTWVGLDDTQRGAYILGLAKDTLDADATFADVKIGEVAASVVEPTYTEKGSRSASVALSLTDTDGKTELKETATYKAETPIKEVLPTADEAQDVLDAYVATKVGQVDEIKFYTDSSTDELVDIIAAAIEYEFATTNANPQVTSNAHEQDGIPTFSLDASSLVVSFVGVDEHGYTTSTSASDQLKLTGSYTLVNNMRDGDKKNYSFELIGVVGHSAVEQVKEVIETVDDNKDDWNYKAAVKAVQAATDVDAKKAAAIAEVEKLVVKQLGETKINGVPVDDDGLYPTYVADYVAPGVDEPGKMIVTVIAQLKGSLTKDAVIRAQDLGFDVELIGGVDNNLYADYAIKGVTTVEFEIPALKSIAITKLTFNPTELTVELVPDARNYKSLNVANYLSQYPTTGNDDIVYTVDSDDVAINGSTVTFQSVAGLTFTVTASVAGNEDVSATLTVKTVVDDDLYFEDVQDASKYYFLSVYDIAGKGYVNGVSKTVFNPNGNITRAQLVTVLYRMSGAPNVSTTTQFEDVENLSDTMKKAINWAVRTGITTGVSETSFNPYGAATRGQIATFLYRYGIYRQTIQEDDIVNISTQFSDVNPTSVYARPISWLAETGATSGYTDGTFGVNDACTRGQFVVFLNRLGY